MGLGDAGRRGLMAAPSRNSVPLEFHVDGQAADFLHQDVEGFRHARDHLVFAVDDVLVHLVAALHVVGLHRQHFLQGVGRAVGFQRPDFHFAEALAAELRLAAQRLLGDERVRTGRTRVHLVVDQVVELQHVHVTHGDRALERFAGATVVQHGLPAQRQLGEFEHLLDLEFGRAVEHRRRHRHAVGQVAGQAQQFLIGELRQVHALADHRVVVVVDLVEELAQFRDRRLRLEHAVDLLAQALRGPAKVRLEDLADVHTARHAQRVQHDVDGRTVGHVRHVFDRHDGRHDTLVAVAAGHLVARLDAALNREEHLHHLEHARGEVVALGDLAALVGEAALELLLVRVDLLLRALDGVVGLVVLHAQLEPLGLLQAVEVLVGDRIALLEVVRTTVGDLAEQLRAQAGVDRAFEDAELVVEVLLDATDFRLFDLAGALVLLDAVAGEDLHVDDGAVHARRNAERAVLHVGGLLAEDRAKELLFRRQLRFALRRDLADHDVAGAHFGADVHHAGFVEAVERLLRNVRDVGGDFLRAQLGVARDAGQLFDVDRGVAILFHHALGEQDGVFEVVAVPRHERDQHVLAERELADVGRGTVGQHVAAGHAVAHVHQRGLVDAGVLVGARVLDQRVDVDAGVGAAADFGFVDLDHDAAGVDLLDHATAARVHRHARVARHGALDAGAHQRLLRLQRRHGLALHVRAHQRAVRVVVLEEGHERGRDRHGLHRRDVHEVDLARRLEQRFTLVAARHELRGDAALVVGRRVGLRDDVLVLFDRREEFDVVGDLAVHDLAVRRLEEAVAVGAREHGERVDQADVRAFRRLDGADAAVMGRVHVADFEARALARQAARAEGRDATLVRDFRQRVVLVHELRQLRGAEELLDRGGHRLGVDQFLRRQAFGLGHRQAFLDRALDADQAHAEHVLGHFTDRTHAAVAQVVDVVHHATAVADLGQHADDVEDVGGVALCGDQALRFLVLAVLVVAEVLAIVEDGRTRHFLATDAAVELHAADAGDVVALEGEEQVVEEVFRGVLGGRFARTHHAVDLDQRFELGARGVDAQRVRQVRAAVQVVHPDRADRVDARLAELRQLVVVDFVVRDGEQFARLRVDDVVRQDAAHEVGIRHGQRGDAGLFELLDVARGDALAGFDDDAVAGGQVEVERFSAQALGQQLQLHAFGFDVERVDLEERTQHFFVVVAERAQQHRDRQLAAAVDAGEQRVLGIELEVEPRAAVGNDARGVQQLARAVRLAAVVVEEHARRTVQLRDDDALGAVDDEGAVVGHERDLAHVDLLLLHVLDGLGRRLAVVDHQAHGHAQRGAVGQATVAALTLVERRVAEAVADVFERSVAAVG